MTPDYASLDAAIVKEIRRAGAGGTKFETIHDEVWSVAKIISPWTGKLVEKRLKALCQRGLIVYNNGRWSAVESEK